MNMFYSTAKKSAQYLHLLPRHPQEFFKRTAEAIELRFDRLLRKPTAYDAISWDSAIQDVETYFGHAVDILNEPALSTLEEEVHQRLERIHNVAPFSLHYNADLTLARCCYLACRLLRPSTVVETGVAYGVTSAFILRGLEKNGHGRLYSVDLPPPGRDAKRFVGMAIPQELKSRWNLIYGFSESVLPKLLKETKGVDVFVQDSLHTYRNMRREFDTLWPCIRPGGMIIADDIELNRAFCELQQQDLSFKCAIQQVEKSALFGVAIKRAFSC